MNEPRPAKASEIIIPSAMMTGTPPTPALKSIPAIILLGVLIALGFAAIGAYIGLRSGSGEAVQGIFPLLFVFLFLSSVNLPRNLIEQDWFRTVATYNPVSYLVEGVRSLIITGWDGEALARGFGLALLLAVGSITLASGALRTRLIRT